MGKGTALPKNIRQIGDIQGKEKICIEDYVMTYIRKKEQQEEQGYLGIFLGEQQETEESVYVFIRGIFEVPAAAPKENTEETKEPEAQWEAWKQECRKYFPDWSVQGCCVIGTYQTERMKELAEFVPEAGGLIYHLQEQEETVYWTDENQYRRIKGYFVFYEQNRKMQEYLSDVFKDDSVEKESLPDKAIKNFREKVKEKGEKRNSSLLKLASSFFVITVLAVGAIVVNRVEDIRTAKNALNTQDNTVENEIRFGVEPADTLQAGEKASGAAQVSAEVSGAAQRSGEVSGAAQGSGEADKAAQGNMELAGSDAFWEELVSDTDGEALNSSSSNVSSTGQISGAGTAVQSEADAANAGAAVQSEADAANAGAMAQSEASLTETEPAQAGASKEASSRQVQAAYIIKEGDTLANICKKYYGTFDRLSEICEANGISDANMIMPGQKIVLP